ncbi:hypothetical protein TVAG_406700 [Trichomonas vaginalis G3]|uniref:Uncharacterized protein n=1 Tax=Trichomonas vaginalis (strain ATCC PRA-98 / G3) TaxID=412133 RepID=A2EXE4_TRIV3|nr:cilia- and flagella-associated protein 58-related family [Trichomonas vaginalis G3]EAY02693.1 hypothetical protein TVAG_406700 [Trichomonas vaginalis G3]KAI5507602.1 cilia- and flagella-associated protein 58-related family [Trichomonas vaginalis G3]|eukprot:XP_001314916.1 hypothetical protein [Trichomonas vaginalis G3]
MNVANSIADAEELVNFAELEQSFSRVVQDMVNDKSLEKFRIEYEKLHEALIASHEHNKILVAKCNELNDDILKNAKQITNIISLTQADQRTINTLRQEFEKAWVIVEESTNKEQQARRIINNLKEEVDNLSNLIAKSGNIHDDPEISMQDVEKEINEIKTEINTNRDLISQITDDISTSRTKFYEIKDEIKKIKPQIEIDEQDIQDTLRNIESIHGESVEVHNKVGDIQIEITKSNLSSNEINDQYNSKKEDLKELNRRLENVKNSMAIYIDERASIDAVVNQLKINLHEAQTQTKYYERQFNDKNAKYNDIVENSKDLPQKIVELDSEAKDLILDQAEIKKYKEKLTEAKLDYRMCLAKNRDMTLDAKREINGEILDARRYRLKADTVEKQTREIEKSIANEVSESQHQVLQQDSAKKDINNQKLTINELLKIIEQIREEIRSSIDESRESNNNLQQQEAKIEATKKKIDEANIKLNEIQLNIKKVSQSRDIMRNERDFVGQKLKIERSQTDGIKKSYETSKRQTESLKDEIMTLDEQGVREHLELLHFENELEELEKVNEKTRNDTFLKHSEAKVMEKNVLNHRHILQEAEVDIESMKRNISNVQQSISLIQNTIAEKLVEKRNQNSSIIAMNNILNQNVHSFDSLVAKILESKEILSRELERQNLLKRKVEIMKALKSEVTRLEKELVTAESYEAAIVEELQTPITIPKWIFLDATNPELASLMRMKLTLLNEIADKMDLQAKLKIKRQQLDDKLEKETKKIVKIRGTVFEEEYSLLQNELKRKNRELSIMQKRFEKTSVDVNERFEEIESARSELRQERNEYQVLKQRTMSARQSISNNGKEERMSKGKFKFNERVKGRDLMYVGGGFAYGRTQNVPLIQPQAKKEKFLPTINLQDKDDLRRKRASKCSEPISNRNSTTEEFNVRPPSGRTKKSKNPRSSRRRMKKPDDETY